ncbi:hypothetical protein [Bacillus velezensis]|uniref:hypothetical protein n=1 Tax=Bacillus velezensis TaxID=492670 RepID=UPI0015F372D7|nr:hypothetical protein [Bacillus velezensis]
MEHSGYLSACTITGRNSFHHMMDKENDPYVLSGVFHSKTEVDLMNLFKLYNTLSTVTMY